MRQRKHERFKGKVRFRDAAMIRRGELRPENNHRSFCPRVDSGTCRSTYPSDPVMTGDV
jgi:hypothetical protein